MTRLVALLAGLIACTSTPVPPVAPTKPAAQPAPTHTGPAVPLSEIAGVFGLEAPSTAADVTAFRRWVREQLLPSDEFYQRFVPELIPLVRDLVGSTVSRVPLREGKSGAKGTFYYRFATCADQDLISVQPWWAPTTKVLVCSEDYRPDVLVGTNGQGCDVTWGPLPRAAGCGCGPYLMYCGTEQLQKLTQRGTARELIDTVAYVVKQDLPFGNLLTMRDTVRNGYAELWHARVDYFLGRAFEFPNLDQKPELRPRAAEFEGGILSTPKLLFGDGPRSVTATVWKEFLCVPFDSIQVETHRVLEETRNQSKDVRADAMMYLTKATGCQNCHTKLENGLLARGGWQPNFRGSHFIKPDPPQSAVFYVHDQTDPRGEGTASLGWLGETIVKQPEFVDCSVSKILGMVYEGQYAPQPVHDALVARFAKGQNMGHLIEDAIIARAFGVDAIRQNGTP